MEPILDEIKKALKRKRLSASAASMLAVGNYSLIKNMKADRGEQKRLNFFALQRLAEVLDLELYFGPPRGDPAPVTQIDDTPFDTVARYANEAGAGVGTESFDAPPIDHLAFSRSWLAQNGINAGASALINARGDSMEPSIYDGDLVMLDRRRKTIRSGRIYVYRDPDDGLRVKRLEIIGDAAISVRSDNPKYPPEHRTGPEMNTISENIVGEVVWSGHTWI